MRTRHLFMCLVLSLLTVLSAGQARAEDAAAAELLFQKGRDALDAGDFDDACQMFGQSLALDPAVGTIMNLAVCEKERGHFTKSWERWHQALDLLDESDDRWDFAVIQLEAVEAQLAYLRIVPKKDAPKGLTLRRDDVALGSAGLGQELPVNPGQHVIVAQSPGHEVKRYTVTLEAGQHEELAVTAGRPVDKGTTRSKRKTRKALGIAALGVGTAGLTAALTTGALLPAQHEKVEEGCPANSCTPDGAEALSGAKTLLGLNTAGWIVAGVGAAAGVTLLLTLPSDAEGVVRPAARRKTVGVAVSGNGLRLFGSF